MKPWSLIIELVGDSISFMAWTTCCQAWTAHWRAKKLRFTFVGNKYSAPIVNTAWFAKRPFGLLNLGQPMVLPRHRQAQTDGKASAVDDTCHPKWYVRKSVVIIRNHVNRCGLAIISWCVNTVNCKTNIIICYSTVSKIT